MEGVSQFSETHNATRLPLIGMRSFLSRDDDGHGEASPLYCSHSQVVSHCCFLAAQTFPTSVPCAPPNPGSIHGRLSPLNLRLSTRCCSYIGFEMETAIVATYDS